ncbi:TPA: MerR family transcriptional regulator, partial [Enterococcus faecium]
SLLTKKIAEMQECLERLQGKIKKYDRVLSRNKMECIK